MKKRKLIHPRKVVWAMRDFINEIHELTYIASIVPRIDGESVDDFMKRWHHDIQEVEERASVKLITMHGFCAFLEDQGEEFFRIGYNFDELWSKGSFQFAQNFYSRCPMGRGFASVTLAILHELGHFHSQQNFEGYDRELALKNISENFAPQFANFEYFKLPDEKSATDWAIEWLSHPENRKIAKRFEKKFFECFE